MCCCLCQRQLLPSRCRVSMPSTKQATPPHTSVGTASSHGSAKSSGQTLFLGGTGGDHPGGRRGRRGGRRRCTQHREEARSPEGKVQGRGLVDQTGGSSDPYMRKEVAQGSLLSPHTADHAALFFATASCSTVFHSI